MAFSREVRLGIVMYGGVSLAVYENGVAQELFRAVKGEGVYRLIKELTDSDIIVDIMSGTSAGGINGIMLGYALANDRDFTASADLWRNDGDILKLLREPSDRNNLSILDSRGFYQSRLEAAYAGMPAYQIPEGIPCACSKTEELDVFVTGTNVQGRIFTEFDEEGHPIDVKDHRQVFLLSYRDDRKNEFKPAYAAALAKLSRTTSCFPVAFEPVRVPDPDPAHAESDDLLRRWGYLPKEEVMYFLDGGLLDNKPFTSTIKEIFHRTASRPVHRMLFYVEPDPEKFVMKPSTNPPDVMQSALDALVNIPGYQSIASDLQEIAEHNDRVQSYSDIIEQCVKNARLPADANGVDSNSIDLVKGIADPARKALYLHCRLTQLMRRGVDAILNESGNKLQLKNEDDRHAANILVQSFSQFADIAPGDPEALRILDTFDVYFRIRRLFYVTAKIQDLLEDPKQQQCAEYRDLWLRINHHVKLLEMVQFALERSADVSQIDWQDLKNATADARLAEQKWMKLQNVLSHVLAPGLGIRPDAALKKWAELDKDERLISQDRLEAERRQRSEFMNALYERIKAATSATGNEQPRTGKLLFQELDELEREVLKQYSPQGKSDPAAQAYAQFPIVDSYIFPLQFMSGMESTDPIHTVRVSPIDAKRGFSNRSLDDKICGNELAHFGGFMKSSWRANDIMWGRLDALCELVECLLTPERASKLSRSFVLRPDELNAYFPHATVEELERLSLLMRQLKEVAAQKIKKPFEELWELLTRMGQREILEQEVPLVIDSAVRQQREWNQYLYQAGQGSVPTSHNATVWQTGVKTMDAAVTAYAARQMSAVSKPDEGWSKFFETNYHVGEENVDNGIPKPILMEIASQAALRLRESIVDVTGDRKSAIRASKLYKFLAKWPIDASYAIAHTQRTWPEWFTRLVIAGLVGSVAVLAVDAVFWKGLVSDLGWAMRAIVVGIPLVVLGAALYVLIKLTPRRQEPRLYLRTVYLHPVSADAWLQRQARLTLEDASDVLRAAVVAIEKAGLYPELDLLQKDLSAIIAGRKGLRTWLLKGEDGTAVLARIQIKMKLGGEEWVFKLGEKAMPKAVPPTKKEPSGPPDNKQSAATAMHGEDKKH
jgi:patatin-related protein